MSKLIDEYLDQLDESVMGAMLAVSAISTLMSAFSLYKKNFTKAARRCKDLPDREKAICMIQAKLTAKNVLLQTLKNNIAKCNKDKNPEQCKQKFNSKIQKIGSEVEFLSKRFKELKSQKYS